MTRTLRPERALALACLLGALGCQSRPVEVTILHTNDLHSHLRPVASAPLGLGGLARLKTLLDRLRAQHPDAVTLDAGDWSEGTWYYDVDTGANMLGLLGALGYDAVALGNHDFLNGPDRLLQTVRDGAGPPLLAANLDASGYAHSAELDRAVRPAVRRLVTPSGVRVGIIGLTTFEGIYDGYLAPVRITDPLSAAVREAALLRPEVDLLLLVSHNQLEVNEVLAKLVPGVDAVISGHAHRKTPEPVVVTGLLGNRVPVVEAGEWGEFLGELTLTVDLGLHRVSLAGYTLHPVGADLPEDPAIAARVAREDARLNAQVGQDVRLPVAQSELALERSETQESPLGNLTVRAYRALTGADLALEDGTLLGVALPEGAVSLQDLHDVMPHLFRPETGRAWTVLTWQARGRDLDLLLRAFLEGSALLPASPLGWLAEDGARLTWNPDPEHLALEAVELNGAPLDRGATYRVALTEGLLAALRQANATLGLGLDLSQVSDSGVEAWRSVADYAAARGRLTRADLGVGGRLRTPGPDLAAFSYGLARAGAALSLEVENQGASPARATHVACFTGVPDAPELLGTSSQRWSPLGEVALPALDPGASTQVSLPWSPAPGAWPVRCEVAAPLGEAYRANNHPERLFLVGQGGSG